MKAHLRIAIAVAVAVASACHRSETARDAGVAVSDRTLVDEVQQRAERMADRRFRAELIADLAEADVEAGVSAEAAIAQAEVFAKDVHDPGEREHVEGIIARVRAEGDDFAKAVETAERIHGGDEKSRVLADLARVATKKADFDRANAITRTIPDEEERCTSAVQIARALAGVQKVAAANDALKACPKKKTREGAYPAIVAAQANAKLYGSAQKLAESMESGHFRSEALSELAEAYYRTGNVKEAMKHARSIESAWIEARTYAAMGLAAKRSNKPSDKLFQKAVNAAEDIKEKLMHDSALEDIAILEVEADRFDEVRALAMKSPSREGRHKILAALVSRYAKTGRISEALPLAAELAEDPVWGGPAISSVALAMAEAGGEGPALDLVATIPNLSVRLPIIAHIAVAQARGKHALTADLAAKLERALLPEAKS
jgi:hypothetical protein